MVGSLATAGCLTDGRSGTPTREPTTDRPSPADARRSEDGITPGIDRFQPDHPIYLSNAGTRERVVRVEVVREATDTAVFAEALSIPPGAEREVYNLAQSDADGIESFSICGQLVDPTPTVESPTESTAECISMRTDACYGSAHVTVDDERIDVIYTIC